MGVTALAEMTEAITADPSALVGGLNITVRFENIRGDLNTCWVHLMRALEACWTYLRRVPTHWSCVGIHT